MLRRAKTIDSVELRISPASKIRYCPRILKEVRMIYQVRGNFFRDNLNLIECADLQDQGIIV
ncbi:MAG: hypothetical protein GF383_12050 [Candidatus Lokiarchaeota archaeon]|nr:hypothetical protein [Candidatus Lokiarchaeota archaeon]MBD3341638.1 hypothetical protein [Candidatus Lokiarchaeota archaeon]